MRLCMESHFELSSPAHRAILNGKKVKEANVIIADGITIALA